VIVLVVCHAAVLVSLRPLMEFFFQHRTRDPSGVLEHEPAAVETSSE
jgi:hypothetical protein